MTLDDIYNHALSFYGIPYEWGGDGTKYGYDCSGYVQKILQFAGIDPPGDQAAHNLYQWAQVKGTPLKARGSLAFFGTAESCTHVGWLIDDKIMISAAGGGSNCKTPHIAKSLNAYIKIQPISWYKTPPFLGAWMPRYKFT